MKKRIFAMLIAAVLVLSLTGCSATASPDSAVKAYCKGLKALDNGQMNKVLVRKNTSELDLDMGGIGDFIRKQASKISYEVLETTIDGDTARVRVSFTFTDASSVLREAVKESIASALNGMFKSSTDEEAGDSFARIFNEKAADAKLGTATQEETFTCKCIDGEWYVDKVPTGLTNIMCCNMLDILSTLGIN